MKTVCQPMNFCIQANTHESHSMFAQLAMCLFHDLLGFTSIFIIMTCYITYYKEKKVNNTVTIAKKKVAIAASPLTTCHVCLFVLIAM